MPGPLKTDLQARNSDWMAAEDASTLRRGRRWQLRPPPPPPPPPPFFLITLSTSRMASRQSRLLLLPATAAAAAGEIPSNFIHENQSRSTHGGRA